MGVGGLYGCGSKPWFKPVVGRRSVATWSLPLGFVRVLQGRLDDDCGSLVLAGRFVLLVVQVFNEHPAAGVPKGILWEGQVVTVS